MAHQITNSLIKTTVSKESLTLLPLPLTELFLLCALPHTTHVELLLCPMKTEFSRSRHLSLVLCAECGHCLNSQPFILLNLWRVLYSFRWGTEYTNGLSLLNPSRLVFMVACFCPLAERGDDRWRSRFGFYGPVGSDDDQIAMRC